MIPSTGTSSEEEKLGSKIETQERIISEINVSTRVEVEEVEQRVKVVTTTRPHSPPATDKTSGDDKEIYRSRGEMMSFTDGASFIKNDCTINQTSHWLI